MSYNIEKGVRIAVRTLKAPYSVFSVSIISKISTNAFSVILKSTLPPPFNVLTNFQFVP